MTQGRAILATLVLPISIGAAAAASEMTMTKARLEVRADPSCTSRTDLVARVAARSPRIRFVDEAALSARVQLTTMRPGNVVAEVVLAAPDSKPSPRRVVARSCAEAADAAALIIAVTLDPTLAHKPAAVAIRELGAASEGGNGFQAGSDTPTKSPAPSRVPAASVSRPTSKPAERPDIAKPDTEPVAERPDIAKPDTEPVAVTSVTPPAPHPKVASRHGLGAYATGEAVFGPAPAVMPGVAIYFLAAIDRDALWSPALLLGVAHAWRSDLSEAGGRASFALDAGSIDACPLRLRWSSFVARPCASLLVGRMATSGNGPGSPEAASEARPFAVAGGAVILTVGIGSVIELTGRLGTGVTLVRDSYGWFAPNVFHRASLLTTSASLGIGFRWP
jgi:hypothetical protein